MFRFAGGVLWLCFRLCCCFFSFLLSCLGSAHCGCAGFRCDCRLPILLVALGLLLIHDALFFHSRPLMESPSRHCGGGGTRSCRMVPIPAEQEPPIKLGE